MTGTVKKVFKKIGRFVKKHVMGFVIGLSVGAAVVIGIKCKNAVSDEEITTALSHFVQDIMNVVSERVTPEESVTELFCKVLDGLYDCAVDPFNVPMSPNRLSIEQMLNT